MSGFEPRVINSNGRSVDEAIYNGLQELGVAIDEVEIEVVQQGSKGVLGIGAKPCVVRLTERDPRLLMMMDEKPAPARGEPSAREERQTDAEGRADTDGERPGRRDQPRSGRPGGDRPRRDGARGNASARSRNEPSLAASSLNYQPYDAAEKNEAAEFLGGALQRMGVQASLYVAEEDGIRKIKIISESMSLLIGHRGETLDALQYLTSLAVNRGKQDYQRISIDTENYRSKREETLSRLARKIAAQVRSTGRSVTLEPMNPYERRVLHASLQDHPHVTTYSVGEEPTRSVVIASKRDRA